MPTRRPAPPLLALLFALAPGALFAQVPLGVETAETTRLRAKVLTVDREAGQILMRDLATGEVFVHAPPGGIEGLVAASSGDVVEAVTTEGVTARLAEPGDVNATRTERATAAMMQDGSRGAMRGFAGGTLLSSIVTLRTWDREAGIAAGVTPEGEEVEYRVRSEEGRAFLDSLSPGDRIEVEISRAVLLQLQPR